MKMFDEEKQTIRIYISRVLDNINVLCIFLFEMILVLVISIIAVIRNVRASRG